MVLLALGDVAHHADIERLALKLGFADGKIDRYGAAILAAAGDLPADAYDLPLAGPQVVCEIAVMIVCMLCRHDHRNVLTEDFFERVSESRRRARGPVQDGALLVDGHDAGIDIIHDGLEAGMVGPRIQLQGRPAIDFLSEFRSCLELPAGEGGGQGGGTKTDHQQRDDDSHGRRIESAFRPEYAGQGEEQGCLHRRVMHTGDAAAHDDRGNRNGQWPERIHAAEQDENAKRDKGQDNGNQNRERDRIDIIQEQGIEPHRGHSGIMHGADAAALQNGADGEFAECDPVAPADHQQGDRAGEHARYHGGERDERIVGNTAGQGEGQHADKMHAPDTAAHAAAARGQPGGARAFAFCRGNAGGGRQGDNRRYNRNEY